MLSGISISQFGFLVSVSDLNQNSGFGHTLMSLVALHSLVTLYPLKFKISIKGLVYEIKFRKFPTVFTAHCAAPPRTSLYHVLSVEAKPNTLTEDFEKGLSSSANNQWKGRQGRGHAAVAQWPKCLVFRPKIITTILTI